MSTHFRPRPPSVPTSPVRPSTAHSTIRAVTPSPPHDLPRPKSAHAIHSPDLTSFAHYMLKSDGSKMFSNTPPTDRPGSGMLRRSGARASRSVSPVKTRRGRDGSPVKMRRESPTKAKEPSESRENGGEGVIIAEDKAPNHSTPSDDDKDDVACPDTPTPIPRSQKRSAYLPLGSPIPLSLPQLAHIPATTSNTTSNASPTTPPIPPKSPSRNPTRISLSGASNLTALTDLSAASNHSVFSTPGRDELERKKALVEVDEGPFGRVGSVAGLREERRRISGGREDRGGKKTRDRGGKRDGKKMWDRKGKRDDKWDGERREVKIKPGGCMGCVVM